MPNSRISRAELRDFKCPTWGFEAQLGVFESQLRVLEPQLGVRKVGVEKRKKYYKTYFDSGAFDESSIKD